MAPFNHFLTRLGVLCGETYEKSFRDTYMVLLDVLDEGRVIELCRVIAAGRQIAARREKEIHT